MCVFVFCVCVCLLQTVCACKFSHEEIIEQFHPPTQKCDHFLMDGVKCSAGSRVTCVCVHGFKCLLLNILCVFVKGGVHNLFFTFNKLPLTVL